MPHRSPITCVDHHVASGLRVTGGYDGRVVAWVDGRECWATEFDDLVNDVRIDPLGTAVAVAVADRFAFVLDVADGARTMVFGPHGDDVNAVRWSNDGSMLACVMDHLDTTVHVWPTRAGGRAVTLTGHKSGVFAVAFDPSGARLATVAEDATARLWDLATAETSHVLEHPGDPEALDWSADGRHVVTGCDDGVARVWDPTTGALVRELTEAGAAVRFVRFDRTGARVLIGSYDATMRLYDCSTWQVLDTWSAPFQWERAAAFTADGVVIGSFGAAPVEHPIGAAASPAVPPLTYGINALTARDGDPIVGRDDGAVVDVLRSRVLTRHDTIVNTVAVDPSGAIVASADYRGCVHLTPVAGGEPRRVRTEDGGPVNSVVWHPTGGWFASGGYDGCIRTWLADGTCVDTVDAHHGPIKSLAWSTAADLLVAGSSDGSLSAWRGASLRWRARADDLVLVNSVACADEAGVVVTASRDLAVRVWDAATGVLLETLPRAHTKSVKAISVSPDAATILTGSYDGTAIVWHRRGDAWAWTPLRLHGKPGVPAVLRTDGGLLTAGWDGTVGRWTDDGRLVARYAVDEVRA